MTAAASAQMAPKVLYTSADVDGQGGALRCLFDMGNEIANWGYRPILALSTQVGSSPTHENGSMRTYALPLPRPKRGRSVGSYLHDIVETVRCSRRLARIIRREGISLVHANEILDIYCAIAAPIARVPCVWHVRADISSWPFPLRMMLPRIVAGLSSEIIAVSASVEEEVFHLQGV